MSLQSAGALSKRSQANSARKSYRSVKQQDEIEMKQFDELVAPQPQAAQTPEMIRPHEIYDNTSYIQNKGLRLLEIPMNSSLTFQKLLWFHLTFDCVYTVLIWGAVFNRAMTREYDIITVVTCALKIIWLPIELARIKYGYKGNINETFPELIAFLIFTICFVLPLSVLPLIQA